MVLAGLVGAGASVLVVWLLLEHGASGVAGMCDPWETNYTDTIMVNKTATFSAMETKLVRAITCRLPKWRWFCNTEYRTLSYSVQVNRTVPSIEDVTECCPGFSRDNSSDQCVPGCLNGTYGENCTEACSCPENAYQNCDQDSGDCTCLQGWHGTNCTEACSSNTYGDACKHTCNCYSQQICNHVTGDCDMCIPGFRLPDCLKVCPAGMYGHNCSYNCTCERAHSKVGVCHPVTGECLCSNGYEGDDCKTTCSMGTYGHDCNSRCDNCTTGYCDHVDGTCFTCWGKQGHNCSQDCDAGTFGVECLYPCQCNNSDAQSNGSCDPCSGACQCLSGWTGYDCDTACEEGRYGSNCSLKCSCSSSQDCNPVTGNCTCKRGWKGDQCDTACPHGMYGFMCSSNCTCDEGKYGCHPVNGSCDCEKGWDGDHCMAALASSQGEGTMFDDSLTYYIVAAAGAFLAIVLAISIIVFLKHRSTATRGKPTLSVNTHEIEMPNKEPANADNAIDSQQKQVPSTEETDTRIAMQPDDDVCETECSPGKDDDEGDYDKTNVAVVDIDETVPAAETAEETFPDDEEHYVDMKNERCAASKPLRSEIVQIDDEHNDDYDTCHASNNRKKEVSKPDNSYDKFNVNKNFK